MPYLSQHTRMKGIADAFLRDGSLYGPLLGYIREVMTRPSEVHTAEREMIAMHVSRLNGCHFCVGIHRDTLRTMGVAPPVIDGLMKGDLTIHSLRMKTALQFAEQLTNAPEHISTADLDALQRSGWSEQAIEDMINVVALFAAVNRLVDAFGFIGDEAYFKKIGAMLADDGYKQLARRTQSPAPA